MQRLVRSAKAAGGASSGKRSGDSVLLFCRLPGEPYVCCGRLSYESHDGHQQPVKFVWRLDDIEALRKSESFQEILQVK